MDGGVRKRGRLRPSQKMLKAGNRWILTKRLTKESWQEHGGRGAVLKDFLDEVAGGGVVDILIVS